MLAQLAHRQHGLVTRAQLLDAAISAKQIDGRLERGALIRVHRAVYRVGHRAPSIEAHYLAAVLACGENAVLSGPAAGHLQGLLKKPPSIPEVTARTERRVDGVRTRRRPIDPGETTVHRGIPVTTVPRTLVDLASVLSIKDLARACHEAGVRYRTTPKEVAASLNRTPNSQGARKLREVLYGDVRVTLSKLEDKFLERLRGARLELPPETNRPAGGRRVDCRWPAHRLTVELDSYTYHSSRHAWEQDRRREREARARGDELRRYTYEDVFDIPGSMLAELGKLIPRR